MTDIHRQATLRESRECEKVVEERKDGEGFWKVWDGWAQAMLELQQGGGGDSERAPQ